MEVAKDYGSIDQPGFTYCETDYWDETIPVSHQSHNCTVYDNGDNNMTFYSWFNTTECDSEITPTNTEEIKVNNCFNPGSISMKAWCELEIDSDLPRISFFNDTSCDSENEIFKVWFVPNRCFYFDYGEFGDSFSMYVYYNDTMASPRQYNSTDCDPETEFWRETYIAGECNVFGGSGRRAIDGGQMDSIFGHSAELEDVDSNAAANIWYVYVIIGVFSLVPLFLVIFIVVWYLFEYKRNPLEGRVNTKFIRLRNFN
jgi:hypothetical protein